MSSSEPDFQAAFAVPSLADWSRLVEKVLKGADFERRLVSRTADGIRIEPLYTAAAAGPAVTVARAAASQPYAWQARQIIAERDSEAARGLLREELAAGAPSVSLAVEAPGQAGLEASDLEAVLAGTDLAALHVAIEAGEAAIPAAEALAAVWTHAGVAPGDRRAAFNIDPIGALARHGGASQKLESALAEAARFAGAPRWRAGALTLLRADGRPAHEAGGSEAQELGLMLASLVAYLRALETAGLAPAWSLPRIALSLSADADLFLTLAKFRAARLLIRRLAQAVGAGDAASRVQIAATTSERMMTRRDPWVNLLRTCSAGMGAALGGADAITILPFTWPLGRPDAFARRIARNMHVVLAEESGLGRVADPAAGAWHLDTLTRELAAKAWSELQAIEGEGGIAAALRSGSLRQRIGRVAAERAAQVATGRIALTGTSAFPRLGEDGASALPRLVPSRPADGPERIDALAPIRLAAPFEALRDAADAYARRHGRPPRVFLAALGTAAEHATRSTWTANFLAAGGIEAVMSEGFATSADAGLAFSASGTEIACICGTDETYALLGEATAAVLKQAGARRVLLAGRPKDEARLRAAGVDDVVHAGQDQVEALTRLQAALGVS